MNGTRVRGQLQQTSLQHPDGHPPDIGTAFWSLRRVISETGLSRATVYRYTRRGEFPQRRQLGPGRVAWIANEVVAWMESRPKVVDDNNS